MNIEEAKKLMFHCRRLNCDMLPQACAERQGLVNDPESTVQMGNKFRVKSSMIISRPDECIGCKQGKKYSKLKPRPKRNKFIFTDSKGRVEIEQIIKGDSMVEPKKCEKCGKKFDIKSGEDGRKFRYRKLCDECETKPALNPPYKTCLICEKQFEPSADDDMISWSPRLYCSDECRDAAERRRKKRDRRIKRIKSTHDIEYISASASETWDFMVDILDPNADPKLIFVKGFILGARFILK